MNAEDLENNSSVIVLVRNSKQEAHHQVGLGETHAA